MVALFLNRRRRIGHSCRTGRRSVIRESGPPPTDPKINGDGTMSVWIIDTDHRTEAERLRMRPTISPRIRGPHGIARHSIHTDRSSELH